MEAKAEFVATYLNRFNEEFAKNTAEIVIKKGELESLYAFATAKNADIYFVKTKVEKEQLIFRAAYVLEYIYFNYATDFLPYKQRFINDALQTENSSCKRHFLKILVHILRNNEISPKQKHTIAETTLEWLCEKNQKVAVKVWAMNILSLLKSELDWLQEIWADVESVAIQDSTAAIKVRVRRCWK